MPRETFCIQAPPQLISVSEVETLSKRLSQYSSEQFVKDRVQLNTVTITRNQQQLTDLPVNAKNDAASLNCIYMPTGVTGSKTCARNICMNLKGFFPCRQPSVKMSDTVISTTSSAGERALAYSRPLRGTHFRTIGKLTVCAYLKLAYCQSQELGCSGEKDI